LKLQIDLNHKLALSITEACALAGVQRDSLYREINAGRLKTAKIKGRRLVRREALEQWLSDQEAATDEAMGFMEAVK
jgi:excisionase family DNA binding protein